MRRIGVFGGTFDPIHLGHLILAEQCREAGRLDEVWFIPSGKPPHKQAYVITPFAQRVEMIELAIAGHPAFRVDRIEEEMEGLTYTYLVMTELHRRHKDVEFFLLIGSDSLQDLCSKKWREPRVILESAGLLVMLRAGHAAPTPAQVREALNLPEELTLPIEYVRSPPLIDISSHDLRRRVAEGLSIRFLVPRAVECYIHEKSLFRPK
jgi:nicotinate-nucleotide adenylyltransferase